MNIFNKQVQISQGNVNPRNEDLFHILIYQNNFIRYASPEDIIQFVETGIGFIQVPWNKDLDYTENPRQIVSDFVANNQINVPANKIYLFYTVELYETTDEAATLEIDGQSFFAHYRFFHSTNTSFQNFDVKKLIPQIDQNSFRNPENVVEVNHTMAGQSLPTVINNTLDLELIEGTANFIIETIDDEGVETVKLWLYNGQPQRVGVHPDAHDVVSDDLLLITPNEIKEAPTGLNSASSVFEENFTVTDPAGIYEVGDIILAGTKVTDVTKNMLSLPTQTPVLQAPSFSLSDNANNLYKVGSLVTFTLTFNFNRGKILGDLSNGIWNASLEQAKRAGEATNYNIEETDLGVINTLEIINHNVILGQNEFSGTVDYAQGPQPYDSAQNNFNQPLAAGTSQERTTSFEGVYPVFANTGNITVISEQGLLSHSINNFVKTIPSETAVNKHTFEIPKVWLDNNAITAIYFYSNLIGDFDTNTNLLSSFSQTQFTKSVDGNDVEYIRFENTSAEKGQTQYKLIF